MQVIKMNVNDIQLLKNQLEQQAKLFVTEQDNIKLSVSVLTTCVALLRVAEKNMPKSFSQQEFNNVFAGYLGIANRVNGFYKNNTAFFNETESGLLKQILQLLEKAEREKKDLDLKIADSQKKFNVTKTEVERLERKLEAEKKKRRKIEEKKSELQRKLKDIQDRISELERELVDVNSRIANLEPSIDVLVNNVNAARATYEEMLAYYSELKRIQEGIREEGFVDVESFSNRLQTMNASGQEIIAQYDSILQKLTSDIEALQAKIEKRRKAGAIG